MKPVVIVGAGGHGRETAEILRHQADSGAGFELLGFVDDNPKLQGATVLGLRVLGGSPWLQQHRADVAAVVALGHPKLNRQVTARAADLGIDFVSAVSPAARIAASARLGRGVIVFPGVVISTDVVIDDFVTVNVAASISHDSRVGRHSNLNPGARLAGNVRVGAGCYIGMGAHVIQDRVIGDGAVVGAGAAVIRDIPADATAVGVPARVIKTHAEPWQPR